MRDWTESYEECVIYLYWSERAEDNSYGGQVLVPKNTKIKSIMMVIDGEPVKFIRS